MASKEIVFITGANTGIGFEAVKALAQSQKEYHILVGSRSLEKGQSAVTRVNSELPSTKSSLEVIEIDVTDDDSINKAFEHIQSKFGKLDVLVNNAGANFDLFFGKDGPRTRSVFNKTYDVNVSGTQVVTVVFAPLLIKSSSPRLVFITSGRSTLHGASQSIQPKITQSIKPGWPKEGLVISQAYRSSKAALNLLMLSWHWVLKEDGVKTWCISPGFLATGLGGVGKEQLEKMGAGPAWLGGDIIKRVVEGERDADVGKVVTQNGGVQPW